MTDFREISLEKPDIFLALHVKTKGEQILKRMFEINVKYVVQ